MPRAAAREGKSVNQLTPDILKERLGHKKEKKYTRKYDDLDQLFGKWTEAEYREMQAGINEARRVDQEFWE